MSLYVKILFKNLKKKFWRKIVKFKFFINFEVDQGIRVKVKVYKE